MGSEPAQTARKRRSAVVAAGVALAAAGGALALALAPGPPRIRFSDGAVVEIRPVRTGRSILPPPGPFAEALQKMREFVGTKLARGGPSSPSLSKRHHYGLLFDDETLIVGLRIHGLGAEETSLLGFALVAPDRSAFCVPSKGFIRAPGAERAAGSHIEGYCAFSSWPVSGGEVILRVTRVTGMGPGEAGEAVFRAPPNRFAAKAPAGAAPPLRAPLGQGGEAVLSRFILPETAAEAGAPLSFWDNRRGAAFVFEFFRGNAPDPDAAVLSFAVWNGWERPPDERYFRGSLNRFYGGSAVLGQTRVLTLNHTPFWPGNPAPLVTARVASFAEAVSRDVRLEDLPLLDKPPHPGGFLDLFALDAAVTLGLGGGSVEVLGISKPGVLLRTDKQRAPLDHDAPALLLRAATPGFPVAARVWQEAGAPDAAAPRWSGRLPDGFAGGKTGCEAFYIVLDRESPLPPRGVARFAPVYEIEFRPEPQRLDQKTWENEIARLAP